MDFAQGAPIKDSLLSQSGQHDEFTRTVGDSNSGLRQSSTLGGDGRPIDLQHADSTMSQSQTLTPSRGGTLKKKQSLKKSGSIRRTSSTRSARPGSVKSLELGEREKYADGKGDELYSAFFTPVPTSGNPTEILATRFQGKFSRDSWLSGYTWRKMLKDLIAYYRDIQKSYETRSKSMMTMSNIVNNAIAPPGLLTEGGIGQATQILKDYHKQSLAESNKARSIEEDVILQLTGLRSDLQQKIKEIKNLAGDFKNAVAKESEGTRKAVQALQEALGSVDADSGAAAGKGDPYIVKLSVDRQVEKQIDEENYLHRAFLNLENSGRELESIVVGEIQKAYNAYAGILKREADEAYEATERLRNGPIAMRKDLEWNAFVDGNENFVDPRLPIRKVEYIHYPGKDAPAAAEVRSGMLERKSKYLKSYTPGWYVLSPTHLHEFKSADRIEAQSPVMSLYLPEQKLGSHSNIDSSSHKFMLKGRQTGGMHRGHGWVFRAESRETMLAWYEDIKNLTEKTGEERNAFVRKHARSFSAGSHKAGSMSSEGALDEDEADHVPYSATTSQFEQESPQEPTLLKRPQPGGRFPSDINVNRDLRVPLSPSSGASSDDHEAIAADGPSFRPSTPSRQQSRRVQHEEQVTISKQRDHETGTNCADDRDIVAGTTYDPASTGPLRPSSNQPQHNFYEERRDSGIASATNGELVGTPRHEIASSIPLRLSSFQAHHNKEDKDRQARPNEPVRTMSDDPETVAAAMGLPGSNFPYVQSDNQPQLKMEDFPQKSSTAHSPKVIDYLHSGNNQEDTRNPSHVESASPEISDVATYRETASTPADQNIDKPVTSQTTVPTNGSEYYTQAVQAQGISSDAPGSVAYAQDQQSQEDQSATPYETLGLHNIDAKTREPNTDETQTNATSANATDLEANSNLLEKQGQTMKSLQINSQTDFEIGAALQEHREHRQKGLDQRQLAPDPEPQSETASSDQRPPTTSSIKENTNEGPISTPVELGQFGSTPKQPETTTFETSFTSGSVESPIAPLSATIGNSHSKETHQRPPLLSHVTISDLHVPGEFPYSPQAEAAF
ncbi:hypothetical protein MMC18_005252 [Xylographa bjoerkii]|nr:hypothetical protein [Xylographa bjoerkii]